MCIRDQARVTPQRGLDNSQRANNFATMNEIALQVAQLSPAKAMVKHRLFQCGLGFLILVSALSLPRYVMQIGSSSWPMVQGQIIESRLIKGYIKGSTAGFIPGVCYNYNVGGLDFKGSQITFDKGVLSEKEATTWLRDYPTGKVVSVYYNPRDFGTAVLVPGIQSQQRLLFRMAIGFILIFSTVLVLSFFVRPENIWKPNK